MNHEKKLAQLRHRLTRISELRFANLTSPDKDIILRLLDAEAYYVSEMIDVYSRTGDREIKFIETP